MEYKERQWLGYWARAYGEYTEPFDGHEKKLWWRQTFGEDYVRIPASKASGAKELCDCSYACICSGQYTPLAFPHDADTFSQQQQQPRYKSFGRLSELLAEGTALSISSSYSADRWEGSYSRGMLFQGQCFSHPSMVTAEFSRRITEAHPARTEPGDGWKMVKVEDGPYAGMTLGEAYAAHFQH